MMQTHTKLELEPITDIFFGGTAKASIAMDPSTRKRVREAAPVFEKRKKNPRTVSFLYNLVNEPWLKYDASSLADTGFAHSGYMDARFASSVLYIETETCATRLPCVV
jgi:hypothetical protein